MRRFFVDESSIQDKQVIIQGKEYHHIVNVLRLKKGDKVVLCVGDKNDYHAEIKSTQNKSVELEIVEVKANKNECAKTVALFQGAAKGEKTDLIIQKAVELGVSSIHLFTGKFTTIKDKESDAKLQRLNRISVEAAKQCRRSIAPKVEILSFAECAKKLGQYDGVLVPYELESSKGAREALDGIDKLNSLAVVIGSEGGFSENEIDSLKEIKARMLTLGNRILRCETAAIVALGLVMYELGEMDAE